MENITENQKKEYEAYIKQITPTHNTVANVAKAFVVGGTICLIGQILLTVFNVFSKIVKFGGAGALVPITGFANSVAAPAIEYKKEGQVFGIGCKIFTISGPVILYGIFSSFVLGVGYLILQWLGWIS